MIVLALKLEIQNLFSNEALLRSRSPCAALEEHHDPFVTIQSPNSPSRSPRRARTQWLPEDPKFDKLDSIAATQKFYRSSSISSEWAGGKRGPRLNLIHHKLQAVTKMFLTVLQIRPSAEILRIIGARQKI